MLDVARCVARNSGVEHRIAFFRGRADLVSLPEPGDLLVLELVGNRILNEGLLETVLDARKRLLRPGATIIPARIAIHAQLGHASRFAPLTGELARLGKTYGLDLGPLGRWFDLRRRAGRIVFELGQDDGGFRAASDDRCVVDVDLATFQQAEFDRTVSMVAREHDTANAVALSFEMELCPGVVLSTRAARHKLHWNKPIHLLEREIPVQPGQVVDVRVSYERHGELRVSAGEPDAPRSPLSGAARGLRTRDSDHEKHEKHEKHE